MCFLPDGLYGAVPPRQYSTPCLGPEIPVRLGAPRPLAWPSLRHHVRIEIFVHVSSIVYEAIKFLHRGLVVTCNGYRLGMSIAVMTP